MDRQPHVSETIVNPDQTAPEELSGQGLHFTVLSASFDYFYACCLKFGVITMTEAIIFLCPSFGIFTI